MGAGAVFPYQLVPRAEPAFMGRSETDPDSQVVAGVHRQAWQYCCLCPERTARRGNGRDPLWHGAAVRDCHLPRHADVGWHPAQELAVVTNQRELDRRSVGIKPRGQALACQRHVRTGQRSGRCRERERTGDAGGDRGLERDRDCYLVPGVQGDREARRRAGAAARPPGITPTAAGTASRTAATAANRRLGCFRRASAGKLADFMARSFLPIQELRRMSGKVGAWQIPDQDSRDITPSACLGSTTSEHAYWQTSGEQQRSPR